MSCFPRVVATLTLSKHAPVPPSTQGSFLNPIKKFKICFCYFTEADVSAPPTVVIVEFLLSNFVKFFFLLLTSSEMLTVFTRSKDCYFFCYLLWKSYVFFLLFLLRKMFIIFIWKHASWKVGVRKYSTKFLRMSSVEREFLGCLLLSFTFPSENSDGTSIVWRNWELCRLDMINFFHFSSVKFFHFVVDFFLLSFLLWFHWESWNNFLGKNFAMLKSWKFIYFQK